MPPEASTAQEELKRGRTGAYLTNKLVRRLACAAQAEAGETVQIMRRGKPGGQITPVKQPRKPLDVLRALTDSMTSSPVDTDESIRSWRNNARY